MKLYLMAEENGLRKRWLSVFSNLKPAVISEFSCDIEPQSIVMITDTLLERIDKKDVEPFFSHRVMVLSVTPNFAEAQKYLRYGAMGYGNALMHETHLNSAYQALSDGKVWLHPDFISLLISQIGMYAAPSKNLPSVLEALTAREREVAVMLGEGCSHQNISDTLKITVRTVKAHAASIYQKLNVKDRLALSLLLHS